uniref:mRNA capping enzyme, catalytic domain n=1 Tax=Virus NIOZ-UU159 TaxID=2763270 RepID=A0A7S9XHN9_9VIRU|nr:MAG: mRNA capping enzyme, catalytic domain [Virus NIOZ-UU159]|tara:strand:- start:1049 stop:2092 length:1044 start_codon:yes stop_codon:yes gene_type:complete
MIDTILQYTHHINLMQGIISFSNRIAFNIKSNDHKDLILSDLYNKYNIKILQRHHHNLDSNNVNFILSNHMLNLRSNGNRYYLYFTLYNDIEIMYYIDKKIHPGYQRPRIIFGRGLFDKKLFKNTLLDGEMVKCKDDSWTFLINDIVCYEGIHLKNKTLPERLNIIYNMLATQYTPDKTIDVCNYKVKTYYNLYKESINAIQELTKNLNYTCRGIYIWPYDLKYKPKLYNFDDTNIIEVVRRTKDITEFKTIENITKTEEVVIEKKYDINIGEDDKVLYLTKTNEPDIYNVYDNEDINNMLGIALVQTLRDSKMLRTAFKDKNAMTIIAFVCTYNNKFKKWHPRAIS